MLKLVVAAAAVGILAVATSSVACAADHYVSGYTRRDGTYVQPHFQSNPNSTTSDNYSTRGNVNPYTGQLGTQPDTRPSFGSTYTAPTYTTPQYGRTTPALGSSYGSQPKPCRSSFGC